MKRIVLLITFVAALSLCAGAQTLIDFHEMPIASTPAPMPDLYASLYWDGFNYVTPGLWKGAGLGFWVDPSTKHNTVAFTGGPYCQLSVPCAGMIKMNPIMATMVNKTFTPINIIMSAGWTWNTVTVTAYNSGKYVGTVQWKLTTTPQLYTFPAAWNVTQLVVTPGMASNAVTAEGSVVIYKFMYMPNN